MSALKLISGFHCRCGHSFAYIFSLFAWKALQRRTSFLHERDGVVVLSVQDRCRVVSAGDAGAVADGAGAAAVPVPVPVPVPIPIPVAVSPSVVVAGTGRGGSGQDLSQQPVHGVGAAADVAAAAEPATAVAAAANVATAVAAAASEAAAVAAAAVAAATDVAAVVPAPRGAARLVRPVRFEPLGPGQIAAAVAVRVAPAGAGVIVSVKQSWL